MKRVVFIIFLGLFFFGVGFILRGYVKNKPAESIQKIIPIPKPLEAYTFENLAKDVIKPGKITVGEVLAEKEKFSSYLFTFEFQPNPEKSEVKKTTGMLSLPKGTGPFPVILMLRGYVDQKLYQTGVGTKNDSYFFADNGFITLAPDFLGYGKSDKEADNIFESRFQTYTTTLSLLKTLQANPELQMENAKWKIENIGLWGHSNGGQIALTVLEITGKNHPAVLWAPVSKPFPYSILYYTDESGDRGKFIRSELAKFENLYDVEKYSLTNYFDRINKDINIQIHQGTNDDAVPVAWTKTLVKNLEDQEITPEYYTYSGADHNLKPFWDLAIQRSLSFFQATLK